MKYQESLNAADEQKKRYADGIDFVIRMLEEDITAARDPYLKHLFVAAEKYREDLAKTIGWPMGATRPTTPPDVTAELLYEDDAVTCSRLRIRLFGEFYAGGLFFRQKAEGKHPLVVVQHGGVGSPELIAGFYNGGNTHNYNDMLSRVLSRGAHVFAPQLLLWNKETHGNLPYNRELADARLRRSGSSLAALELFTVIRSLDYFTSLDTVDTIGMVGLSYGGFYALYTAALDTRIHATVASSHFFSRETIPTVDRSFGGKCFLDDAAVATLVYPRTLVITVGKNDPLFSYSAAEAQWKRFLGYCEQEKIHRDWVEFLPFEGNHEFPKDDEALDILFDALTTPTPKGRYETN